MKKKLLGLVLSLSLALGMSTVALAANQDASFTKTYKKTNTDTQNPTEIFTFTYTAYKVTDSNKNLKVSDMPTIVNSTVTFATNTATKKGLEKKVNVALSDVTWPGVGIYYYEVKETPGNTAGVSYDPATAYLKVTVAYDEGTDTYYTAFVTLDGTFADDNEDGKTDVKIGGFINTYSAGALKIKKTVTGNMGNKDTYFAVKVKLTGETGKTYLDSYAVTGGSYTSNPTSIAIGAETTFYLKDSDTITISNLPYGVTYTVVEDDYTSEATGGYETAAYKFSDDNKKIDTPADSVEITNTKNVGIDTGILVDSMPYILILAFVCTGLLIFCLRRRKMN